MADMDANYNRVLEAHYNKNDEILGLILATQEGIPVATAFSEKYDVETIGTIMSSTLNIAKENIQTITQQKIKQITIKGKQGFIVLRAAGQDLLLLALATLDVNMNLLCNNIHIIADEVAQAQERV